MWVTIRARNTQIVHVGVATHPHLRHIHFGGEVGLAADQKLHRFRTTTGGREGEREGEREGGRERERERVKERERERT